MECLEEIKSFLCDLNLIKYSTLPIILLIGASFGLKVWLNLEIFLSFTFGAILMTYPRLLYTQQLKESNDEHHLFLCNLLGSYLIYSALYPLFLRKSKDQSIFISHFWSKIISSNLLFITLVLSYMSSNDLRLSHKLLCYYGGALLVTLVINLYFLTKSNVMRSQFHHNLPANNVAKVEFFMLLTAGLILFAFPKEFMIDLNKPNEIHLLLCRACGVYLFSLCIESFIMPSFLYEVDKQRFLKARLLGSLFELVVIGVGYFVHKSIKSNVSLGVYLTVNMSYNILILFGLFTCMKTVNDLKTKARTNVSINTSINSSINIIKSPTNDSKLDNSKQD